MTRNLAIFITALLCMTPYLFAEEHPSARKNIDPDNICANLENQKSKGTDQFVYPASVIEQDNYDGKLYREEISGQLKIEIERIKGLIRDIEKRHSILVKLYPRYKDYQEIVIDEKPGFWDSNEYVYYKKLMAFHFTSDEKVSCVIINSERKNIKSELLFQKKIIRMYYPYIQSMEIESRSHYTHISETMDDASPEQQLKSLRLMTAHLQEGLYAIDLMIASHYNKRFKRNSDLIRI